MNKDDLAEFANAIVKQTIVYYEQIPDIPLYMDQLTTFIDEKLKRYKRQKTDKILTKTMINNYTKDSLIPPSDKKRYDRDHAALLIIVYHLKACLTINDIITLFDAVEAAGMSVEQLYGIFTAIQSRLAENRCKISEIDEIIENVTVAPAWTEAVREIAAVLFFAIGGATRKLTAERILDRMCETPKKDVAKGSATDK